MKWVFIYPTSYVARIGVKTISLLEVQKKWAEILTSTLIKRLYNSYKQPGTLDLASFHKLKATILLLNGPEGMHDHIQRTPQETKCPQLKVCELIGRLYA